MRRRQSAPFYQPQPSWLREKIANSSSTRQFAPRNVDAAPNLAVATNDNSIPDEFGSPAC